VIAPRWRKVFRDLTGRPGRTLLAVVAMAAGAFEVGAMLYKYILLQPELNTMYERTRPASATLILDRIDDRLVESVRRVPGVGEAEARPVVVARVRVGTDEWLPAVLYVVRDFDAQRLDTFRREAGAWPPAEPEMLLERSALQVANVEIGERLVLRTAGGEEQSVRVAGTVHAAGLAPAWMEHMVPGFIRWDSPLRGGDGESAQLRIRVAAHDMDEGHIREVADSVRASVERQGYSVLRLSVPAPGRHPHADQMEAFLFLLLAFGILSFALSTVLVAGMIHALMSEEMRQIGMMKAVGATSRQIAGLYLGQVALLAIGALVVGIPFGLWVGRAYAEFAAGILNADITHAPFPWWLVAAEIVVGVLVPLLVALVPVQRASRITVHDALRNDPDPRYGVSRFDRWLLGLRALPRPLALSLRATFRRRGRVALTVGTLAIGGAVFMSALNVAAAWNRAVDKDFSGRRYDLTLSLAELRATDEIDAVLATVPEVEHAEYWPGASPYLIGAGGVPGGTVALVGPDPGSRLLELPLAEGRWLEPGDTDAAVVNRIVMIRNPSLAVGKPVQVRLGNRTVGFPIVGVVRELAPMPVIYAAQGAVFAATGRSADSARTVRLVTRAHDDGAQRVAAAKLEQAFESAGIEVAGLQRMQSARQSILDHLVIIMAVLTMATLIVVFVGTIALASTLALSVLQRTREFGVLGAVGARPAVIAGHVWLEALGIGILSWLVATLLAVPASFALETACGRIFFRTPLEFHMSPMAIIAWLALVVVLASVSSIVPARRASRMPVRVALAAD
jgi:putative ABC transport system permease protein